MTNFQDYLKIIGDGGHLTEQEAAHAFNIIMRDAATPAQTAAMLMGMKINGETVEEITGAAETLRDKMKPLEISEELRGQIMDVCGTGGDGKGTYNISTTVAFVLAGAGVKVAKHGNSAISSKSGSADVLRALSVNIDMDDEVIVRCIEQANIGFMMAPNYHPAMRLVAPTRRELGMRTIFNLLGPLINPAKPKRQMMGVYDKKWVEPIAHVLHNLGVEKAWVVHGGDGMDEISLTAESYVAELKDGEVNSFTITPEQYGFERLEAIDPLIGGDDFINAQALKNVLGGAQNPYRDVVLLNAAAGLVAAEKAQDFAQGIDLAKESIDSGAAKEALHKLVELSNIDSVLGDHGE